MFFFLELIQNSTYLLNKSKKPYVIAQNSVFLTKSDPETEQPFLSKPIANADIPIPPIPIK